MTSAKQFTLYSACFCMTSLITIAAIYTNSHDVMHNEYLSPILSTVCTQLILLFYSPYISLSLFITIIISDCT